MATNFKKLTELDPNTIMVVDALNLAFRWMHSGAKEFVDEYLQTVESLRKSYKAGKVIIASDMGSSAYRKNIFPGYKSGRKEKQEAQTPEEAAKFEAFFQEFTRVLDMYLEVDDYPMLKYSRCEADDIAAYVVKKYKKTHNIWLISSDRDWDLLVDDNVSRFSYVTRKEIRKDNWNDHYDYSLDDHISIKCIMGDSGDSIPGVDGIGPKRAIELVTRFGNSYEIAASLPISSKYKYVNNLNEFGMDNIIRNYQLMDLVTYCEDAIGVENCKDIDKKLKEYIGV